MNEQNELLKLKNEVPGQIKPHQQGKRKLSWNSTIVTSVLFVLALISIVQTAQSAGALKKIESGGVPSANSSFGTTLPDNLNNLPNMVGGC